MILEKKPKEYQTVRLFMTLAVLTLIAVLLLRVVLFSPTGSDKSRQPAEINSQTEENK
ncbi:MAG: hypothetical protein WA160_16905 [Pseudobdellovibrio sp.]